MVRGRKKDLTLPLTSSLRAQRDFRDRRARHLVELEERYRAPGFVFNWSFDAYGLYISKWM
ncbi:hypothetical protein K488DRAFT_85117 [Vararia minispora EC-137]|uniref:Uncharacterized protein n=1 Tax=Vararia minispora EC-137 TaxID=1314806 RepID=A0ACB8QP64_9AGAM|nr:hypothetical protein K488DRAFT_85117 [Vararia minispora EC-137]